MILRIKVKPGAKTNTIKKHPDGTIHIRIAAAPIEGKANKALIEFLAEFFEISKSSVTIKAGDTSRYKTIELPDDKTIIKKLENLEP